MPDPDQDLARYVFADLVLDPGRRQVKRGSQKLSLSKLTFELLLALVENAPNAVSHEALTRRVWGDRRIVTPENLAQRMLVLRQKLCDAALNPRYVESIRGHGYRLIPPVSKVLSDSPLRETGAVSAGPGTGKQRKMAIAIAGAGIALLAAVVWHGALRGNDSRTASSATNINATRSDSAPAISVAVLPFEQLGEGTQTDRHFADALHAEMVNDLGKNADLKIVARASVMHYAHSEQPVQSIADELHVRHIVKGSVRRSGDRLQVITELVDAATGLQIWTNDYRTTPEQVFDLQWEITKQIALELRVDFDADDGDRLSRLPTRSLEAYAFYIQAMDVFNANAVGSRINAQSFLDQAIVLDPNFAHAYAGKALVQAYQIISTNDAPRIAESANDAAIAAIHINIDTALRLDPNTDLAYYALGMLDMFSWRWRESREALERAITLSPRHATFLAQYGWFRVCALDEPEGIDFAENAVEIDPRNYYGIQRLAEAQDCAGDTQASLLTIDRALQVSPTHFGLRMSRALLTARVNGREAGLTALRELEPLLINQRVLSIPAIALAYRELGEPDEAQRLYDRFVSASESHRTGPANWFLAYMAIGDSDRAHDVLQEAVDAAAAGPGPGFYALMAFRRNADLFRNEPRFAVLHERLRALGR